MRTFLYSLLICCVPTFCYAQPKLKLTASRMSSNGSGISVAKDERVSIQISAEDGSSVAIFCIPKLVYICPPNKTEVTFYATKAVRFMIAAFKDGKVTKQEITVRIDGQPDPGPDIDPDPPPGPGPKPPGPKPSPVPTSKIGKAVYDSAMKVSSTNKVKEAKILAKEFNAVKSKAAAVSTQTYEQTLIAVFSSFKKLTPPTARNKWQSFATGLIGLYKNNGVKDKTSLLNALGETVKGLEAVK